MVSFLLSPSSHSLPARRRATGQASQKPEHLILKNMYLKFIAACRDCGIHTEEGEFGAHMMVSLVNDGPVTITIDSKQRH